MAIWDVLTSTAPSGWMRFRRGRRRRCESQGHPQLLEEAQEIRNGPVLDDGAIDDAVDQQEHEADLFAGWGHSHERPLMGAAQGGHTSKQRPFHQFGFDRMVQVGKGGVQVGQMLARFVQPWMIVEDGPVTLIEGAERLAQDVLRS